MGICLSVSLFVQLLTVQQEQQSRIENYYPIIILNRSYHAVFASASVHMPRNFCENAIRAMI